MTEQTKGGGGERAWQGGREEGTRREPGEDHWKPRVGGEGKMGRRETRVKMKSRVGDRKGKRMRRTKKKWNKRDIYMRKRYALAPTLDPGPKVPLATV